jgi:toxin ParE1/3/4
MKVRFTRSAKRDLDQIQAYVSQDSPTVASRFVARIIERARTLADHPFEGMQTDDPDTRVIMAPRLRYFIFYTIAFNEIHITHIRHMSRRRPKIWNR